MKLFDKIKDLFTDVVEEEIKEDNVEIKEVKKENKLPKIMREENKEDNINLDKVMKDDDLFKDFGNLEVNNNINSNNQNNNFRFPISFEESDLLDDKILSNQNVLLREKEKEKEKEKTSSNELYKSKPKKEEKISLFKVSPVISPVYGILDKNYKKDEVQDKPKTNKDITRNANTKVDFETVRKKAYGSLIDDIKDNMYSNKIEEKKEDSFDDIYKLEENIDEITLGEIENNYSDFGLTIDDYKKSDKVENKEEKEEKEEINITTLEKDNNVEKININDMIFDTKKQEDDFELNNIENKNDIFNLIEDTMYKEEEQNSDRY